jgi:hypothetical protein
LGGFLKTYPDIYLKSSSGNTLHFDADTTKHGVEFQSGIALTIRLVQIKPVRELFWAKELKPLKTVPTGVEGVIQLMHQSMYALRKVLTP